MNREYYETLTVKQLKDILKSRYLRDQGYIVSYGGWKKAELIDALLGLKEVPRSADVHKIPNSGMTKKELAEHIRGLTGWQNTIDENLYTKKQLEEMYYKLLFPARYGDFYHFYQQQSQRKSPPKRHNNNNNNTIFEDGPSILSKHGIFNRKDYLQFVREHHPDLNPNISKKKLDILSTVNQAYENSKWSKSQNKFTPNPQEINHID